MPAGAWPGRGRGTDTGSCRGLPASVIGGNEVAVGRASWPEDPAPAMADLGLAMGTGTGAAIEASDLTLVRVPSALSVAQPRPASDERPGKAALTCVA